MSINLSLLGQMIVFATFVLFTMKFVWPHIAKALEEREAKIADGLAAAERGQRDLELAQHKVSDMLRDAKLQAADIVEKATQRAARVIEEAKEQARKDGEHLIKLARTDIEQEKIKARTDLQQEISTIAVAGASKILGANIDEAANANMIKQLIAEVQGE